MYLVNCNGVLKRFAILYGVLLFEDSGSLVIYYCDDEQASTIPVNAHNDGHF